MKFIMAPNLVNAANLDIFEMHNNNTKKRFMCNVSSIDSVLQKSETGRNIPSQSLEINKIFYDFNLDRISR